MRFRIILLLFMLLGGGIAAAQEFWTNFGQENEITDIAVRGEYVWCATTNGLVRWDKRDMKYRKYTMQDGLPHSVINSLEIAPDGTIWCGTDFDLIRFDGNTWQAIRLPGYYYDGLRVRASTVGPDGSVWVSTSRYSDYAGGYGDLLRYSDSTWTTFDRTYLNPITSQGIIEAISVAPDSTVWLRGYAGIGYRNTAGEFRLSNSMQGHSGVLSVFNGMVWAGTDSGLVKYDGHSLIPLPFPYDLEARALAVKSDGTVWVATESGLLRYDGATWKRYTTADGLPVNSISAVFLDDSGMLWIGTTKGLCVFDGVSFRTWRIPEEMIDGTVNILAFEPNGTAWVGTPTGLSRYNGSDWRSFTTEDGLPDNNIRDITVTPKGDVWIATSKTIARWYGSGWKTYTAGNGLPDSTVYAIQAGKDNTLWVTTASGATRFDGSNWRTYTPADSCLAYPRGLSISGNGNIWVIDGETVSRFDGKSWKNFVIFENHATGWMTAACGGAEDTLYYLNTYNYGTVHNPGYGLKLYTLENAGKFLWDGPGGRSAVVAAGANGDAWVGAGGSLYHINVEGKTSAQYSLDQTITSIAIAPDGAVWCGTDRGISRYGRPLTIGVESEPALPKAFAVMSNHPNPFNPSTTITYTLPVSVRAELSVYSITGQKVSTLVSGRMEAGTHSAVWDGKDDSGKPVSSGIYIAHLRAGERVSSRKMLLMK